jgi:hypothetical protein
MNRRALGNLAGLATVLVVNGAVLCVVGTFTAVDVGAFAVGNVVASLVGLRTWSRPEMSSQSSVWWLLVAVGATLVGALLFWLDIRFGYIVLPIGPDEGVVGTIRNPLAVMMSAAFLPLFASVAIGSAVRSALLSETVAR